MSDFMPPRFNPRCPSPAVRRAFCLSGTASLVLIAAACGDKPTATVKEPTTPAYEQVVFGPEGVLTSNGISRGTIKADSAFTYGGGERLELHSVTATLKDSADADSTIVTAKSGDYQVAGSKLVVHGAVRVLAPGGRRLEADSLLFDLATNAISTTGTYTLVGSPVRRPEGVLVIDPLLRRAIKAPAAKPAAKPAGKAAAGR
ncbi:MAG: hypothetical protein V4617_12495 [Gemmatimonadota bacterium]